MMMKPALAFLFTNLCAFSLVSAKGRFDNRNCCMGPHHMRAAVRYTTPKGIGYNTGYATVEGFFAPANETWIPFVDLRGHVFDDGKFAANAGLGLRYLSTSRVWGVNAYYNYRNAKHQHYNQVSAGLESLGEIWDFRINGYLPVGKTHSHFFHTHFSHFKGHKLLLRSSQDFAMKGGNAEAGIHVDHFKNVPLYFAAGPYYLTGSGKSTWGGQFRASIDLFHRYLRVEGNASYDHFFKWIGQAEVSINIPFGGRSHVTRRGCNSCCKELALQDRAVQRVDRFEIIPVGKRHVTAPAINPVTGDPWVFWFVNNTSSSAGTIESPFPTLLQAQNASSPNQAIYVFPGDGTTKGMSTGIVLQNGQLFLGASVNQPISTTLGKITIPPQASTLPTITNTLGDVVLLASNNTVSGFNIPVNFTNGNGITGIGINNLLASQNTFVTHISGTNGINLINPSGTVTVSNSTFNGFFNLSSLNSGNGIFLQLINGAALDTLSVTGSSFTNINNLGINNGGNGIFALLGGDGSVALPGGCSLANLIVSSSIFSNILDNGNGVFVFL